MFVSQLFWRFDKLKALGIQYSLQMDHVLIYSSYCARTRFTPTLSLSVSLRHFCFMSLADISPSELSYIVLIVPQ